MLTHDVPLLNNFSGKNRMTPTCDLCFCFQKFMLS
uniref:Uncharacterized protein n=1 Tax=Siphoviridae sp. ctnot10 TaxID=2826458 RepID=A0A8S5NDA0_9CAUD|nr:MAG TPA: hypothetical protein [Siphoviridae sp. ctnot10]